jgi:MarR family transcriptional regulator, 2-MHQ and catechol-resistance regulon repressor
MGTHFRGKASEVRALDAFIKLMRASESVMAHLNRRFVDEGLTPSQFAAMEALFHLGPLCQREIGGKLLKSSGNITLVIDNLEKRGLVRRERGSDDRRFITVHLTDEGKALIARIFPAHAEEIASVLSLLTEEEQEELGRLCKKLGSGVERPSS